MHHFLSFRPLRTAAAALRWVWKLMLSHQVQGVEGMMQMVRLSLGFPFPNLYSGLPLLFTRHLQGCCSAPLAEL